MTQTPQQHHLDTSQAARRLNVSDSTVRRWIAAGTLPAKRVGERSWRIDPADLELMVTPSRRSQPLTEDSAELLRTRTEDTTR